MNNYEQWHGQNTTRRWPSARHNRIACVLCIALGAGLPLLIFILATGGFQ